MAKIDGFEKMTENNLAQVEHIFSSVYYTTLATLKPRFKHMGFFTEEEHRIYLEEGQAEETSNFFNDSIQIPIVTGMGNARNCINPLRKNMRLLISMWMPGQVRRPRKNSRRFSKNRCVPCCGS